ncbi:xanthine dehydrogenase [Brevirhabdus pacifica]|uniref:Xanthine dehydrogenase n=1 Tax=Brevirhabdus pacifica TaxID=1267768 RepID=A0A1U7DGA3_9RHOB|nr:xanthine dehydrogenase family protein molybdopterin-binding subunit [Brevirhabdus pacifica]APX88923.1 xanthine dehydrogenase [Brevirhabdus pacifica]OWU80151.1 xanthine dehydrogenase [Loktanella sp. 22II-4b]PJJ86527.1 carbon-monoxide dehydrogenase large subunit [Brevirhabdus pacifica]
MRKFGTSQSVRRIEDVRFLTGTGRYLEDTAPADTLHAVVFRSPVAHGRITALDVSAAEEAPGVHLVLTAEKLEAAGVCLAMKSTVLENRDGTPGAAPERPILARDRVRFVGEAVAVIVADSAIAARDAAELVEFDYEDLPVHVTPRPGGPAIHPEAPDNVALDWGWGDAEATDAAFAAAAHTVSLEVEDNRIISNPMEPRGYWAEMRDDRLHVTISHQNAWAPKERMAELLGMPAADIHVTIPDVGGGFGTKAMDYPEMYCVAQAARMLDRPVLFMADRTETMLSDNGGRDLASSVDLAFDADLRITAYRVETIFNLGAYNGQHAQAIQTELALKVLTGTYDVQTVWFGARAVYTNTNQVDAYRGAGRPEAIYVLERAIDNAARQLGVDPWELRRRNFIAADAFPYTSATGEIYDVGDFHGLLDEAAIRADRAGFAERRAASEARGLLRGQGLCYYIEAILGDPTENSAISFDADGGVTLYVGTISNGQGHETVYRQILEQYSGIPHDRVRVVQGDSDRIASGGGTGGSRSVTTQGTATRANVEAMVEGFAGFLRELWEVDEVLFDAQDHRFRAPGTNRSVDMMGAAGLAREEGRDELLRHDHTATLPGRSYPNGAHVCEVEIDPETGVVTVDRYTVVDDFGVLMNPMLTEGQIHGGVAQGIGQALSEHVVHDADGQLLTASFMDYAVPRARDLPMMGFAHRPVPSTANPLGMKGCGEAGTVGALAAVANAVLDAVWERGVRRVDMPFTPLRTWSMLNADADRI